MVLITDSRDGGGSSPGKVKPLKHAKGAQICPTIVEESPDHTGNDDYDEFLGTCEFDGNNEDFEELDDFSELPDTRSIASDDSFYPPDDDFADSERTPSPESPAPLSFFQACCGNNALIVKLMIRQGVTEEDVRETDKNKRTGLIVACYQGYVDVVMALSQCPHLDVNWSDNEGNTALITASQAGHITICNYLLNYFPGLDIEKRNCHGFSALMKAAMQGRVECVKALMMAGADLEARDNGRKFTAREWAIFTSRHETVLTIMRLMHQPCADQFCDSYRPEWPLLPALVAKAQAPKGCIQKISETLRDFFDISNVTEASEDGVLDHMVRMTTALGSPFIATSCRTVCPGSPPCVGKRRYAVQEILKKRRIEQLKILGPERIENYKRLFQNSRVLLVPKPKDRRASLQPNAQAEDSSTLTIRRTSLLPLHLLRRSSVRPGLVVPKVRITKAPTPTYVPERVRRKSSCVEEQFLQIPKWRYKELKEERKKAEEAERKRLEAITKRQLTTGKRK
ncbi:ankyrin repeat domain-containing protein 33B isoform X1 [Danio rerio]|uniref:Ankyrin repeat domain 33ba n=2 Tax=Danio rerio TaxID=7955 RepID=A0A8N7UVK1_DANRE|nr:ankyrin repeat domain-containing protein 33B [Danio rerio]XP_696682.1 ankyrin repeat domain-containing protein 33B [Danio rerio]|eukprot:XP_021329450.1 ankyrin repeat domain-containing protein 33B [Danio rerio]